MTTWNPLHAAQQQTVGTWQLLESRYGDLSLGDLAANAANIEETIATQALHLAFTDLAKRASKSNAVERELELGGHLYRVNCVPDVCAPILRFAVIDVMNFELTFAVASRTIEGIGLFASIELQVPKRLQHHLGALADLVAATYRTAYQWLGACVSRNMSELETRFAEDLYDLLRVTLDVAGKRDLAQRVWFSIFSEDDGYYALDREAVTSMFDVLRQRRINSPSSPMLHGLALLSLTMPLQKSLSQHAIADRKYREFQLEETPYSKDMNLVLKTEQQLTLNTKYAIFPIARIADRELVASFPATLTSELLPVLTANRDALAAQYSARSTAMRRHIKRVKASFRRADGQSLAGMAGSLLGAFYRAWQG